MLSCPALRALHPAKSESLVVIAAVVALVVARPARPVIPLRTASKVTETRKQSWDDSSLQFQAAPSLGAALLARRVSLCSAVRLAALAASSRPSRSPASEAVPCLLRFKW